MDFQGKTAIVTGGTRGIGKAICEQLLYLDCKVIATGTNVESYIEKNENENLKYMNLNFLDDNSINNFVDKINKMKIDILVNNAGINIVEEIEVLNKESWDKVIQVNLTGPMILINKLSGNMKERGYGRILNVSSIWGIIGKEKRNSYASSKTGLIGLTRTTALDLAKYNVLVNALCPGFTLTELTKSTLSQKEIAELAKEVPQQRFADVEEIAKVALFLVSDWNSYVTGQSIVADGGFCIR